MIAVQLEGLFRVAAAKSGLSANDPIADLGAYRHHGGMSNQSRYAGMTVNERLFDAGLMDAFHSAARARNRAEMIRLLMDVDVEDAASSADTILGSPKRYGY